MARLNQEIISELNAIQDSDKDLRSFLKWLLEFEREHSDKARYSYKPEILKKLESIFDRSSE